MYNNRLIPFNPDKKQMSKYMEMRDITTYCTVPS